MATKFESSDVSRTALVVGGTRGIGGAVVSQLLQRNWKVLAVGRSRPLDDETGRSDTTRGGNAITFIPCDVSLQADVRALAQRVRIVSPSLDLIVHSADVLHTKRSDTSDGVELSFAINCLSRVLLNGLLFDTLNPGATIVHIAAAGLAGRIEPESIPPPPGMSAFAAHNLGQRANDLYGLSLAPRCMGRGVRVMVMQPGMVATSIRRSGDGGRVLKTIVGIAEAVMRPLMTHPDTYAHGLVELIERERGSSLNRDVLFTRRFQGMKVPARYMDPGLAAGVWNKLHQAVGLNPDAT